MSELNTKSSIQYKSLKSIKIKSIIKVYKSIKVLFHRYAIHIKLKYLMSLNQS